MNIFTLKANGPHSVIIGVFTSKGKADKAWTRWKRAFRGTVWSNAKKDLSVIAADTVVLYGKVMAV